MQITVDRRTGGLAVLRVNGRLDFASAQDARDEFGGTITAGYPKLVVDLNEVEFVDSAGLGSLIGGMRAAWQRGGDLRIAHPTEQAKMLLSLTSLDQIFKVYPTVEDALVDFP